MAENYKSYSTIFSTIYDEQTPVGQIGRGGHYSILRCTEWIDIFGNRLSKPSIHDFSIIWDEDHDTRIIPALEKIYIGGLLAPIQFIGERKGGLTVLASEEFNSSVSEETRKLYIERIDKIVNDHDGDYWSVSLGVFNNKKGELNRSDPEGIVSDNDQKVKTYLSNIDVLWSLGNYEYGNKYS